MRATKLCDLIYLVQDKIVNSVIWTNMLTQWQHLL